MTKKKEQFLSESEKKFIGKYSITIIYSTIFHEKYLKDYPFLLVLNEYNSSKYNTDFIIDFQDHYNFKITSKSYFNCEDEQCFISGDDMAELQQIAVESRKYCKEEEVKILEESGLIC